MCQSGMIRHCVWHAQDDTPYRKCVVLRSSGVLLSPGSAAAEKVGASTVMVSKTDAASRPVTPEQKTRPGSAAASQGEEWQIL